MNQAQASRCLERGDLYFLYRPKTVAADTPESAIIPHELTDIQSFYIILKPEKDPHYRLLLSGKKRLPHLKKHEKHWLRMEFVTTNQQALAESLQGLTYSTQTRGQRKQPDIRGCGEGIYHLVWFEHSTYLIYALSFPKQLGEVQKSFNIAKEGSYVLSIKNQYLNRLQGGKRAHWPRHLQERFGDRRFIPANPPELLNYTGAEILWIGARENWPADPMHRYATHHPLVGSDVFKQLKLWKNEHATIPLFEGKWR